MKKLISISKDLKNIIQEFPQSSSEVDETTQSYQFSTHIGGCQWEVDALLLNPFGIPRLFFQVVKNRTLVSGSFPDEIQKAIKAMNTVVNNIC